MKKKYLSILCIVILWGSIQSYTFAQLKADSLKCNSIKLLISDVGDDIWHIVSYPFQMSKNDALILTSFTVVNIAMIYGLDEQIDNELKVEKHNKYLKPIDGLADIGDSYDWLPFGELIFSTTVLTTGIIFNDKKLLETTKIMFESLIITKAITSFSKALFGRSRPYTGKGPYDFNLLKFSTKHEFLSMPSGHTSGIFSIMTVIAKQYDKWWIKIPAYTLGVSVALQRIDDHQHWSSDVIVGGALGYWVGSTLVNRHKKKSKAISFSPYLSPNRIGININF